MGCRDDENSGCCRPAVMRAFQELRVRGEPDLYCFEAALIVYRWHHPEMPPPQATDIVSTWVAGSVRH